MLRTFNSLRNASAGLLYLTVKTLLEFILRTIFIKTLGATYLGVNGLFSNILMILNLAELGVGNAIIFNLYKPVAEKNTSKIQSLMLLYRKCYSIIGFGILIAGLCLMPFIESVIKYDSGSIEHIKFIFLLYLLNTASSYFMVYKTNLITVHEKVFITNIIKMISEVIVVIVQCIILLLFKNFYLYLIILIGNTILTNFICSSYAKKLYPEELDFKNAEKISSAEKKSIFKDVYALMMYKIGGVISNSTSNIVISSFIGLSYVGLYSNYLLIVNAIQKVLINIFNGIVASVGNLNASADRKRALDVYYLLNFLSFYLFGFCSTELFSLCQPFIRFWLGESYILPIATLIAIVLNFYIYGVNNISIMYRNTLGLFIRGKYRPVIGAIINIVLSITLARSFGISGVLYSTAISNLVTTIWYDPRMILKYGFEKTPWKYYIKQILYVVTVILAILLSNIAISFIDGNSLVWIIIKGIVCAVVFHVLFIVIYFRTAEFKGLLKTIMSLFKIKKGSIKR